MVEKKNVVYECLSMHVAILMAMDKVEEHHLD
jgi:hypothetical protein